MARTTTRDTRPRGIPRTCLFCTDHAPWIDYKDLNLMHRFVTDRGKIRARRASGNCAQHQREVQVAIKTARELALLPYAARTEATPKDSSVDANRAVNAELTKVDA